MEVLSALPRAFRMFTIGRSLSSLGDGVGRMGLLWFLVVTHHAGGVYALGATVAMVISILTGPLLGAVADRIDRRKTMVMAESSRAALWFALTFLVSIGRLPLWAFPMYALLASLMAGLYGTNSRLVVPTLVPKELLGRANAVSSLTQRVASMAGPALGGVIVAVAGPASAMAFNALTFCVSACIVYITVPRIETPHAVTPRSLVIDAYRGILDLRRQPAVMRMVLDSTLIDLCLTSFLFILPVFAAKALHGEAMWVGIVEGVLDLGVAVGGLLLITTRFAIRDLSSIPYVAAVLGMVIVSMGLSPSIHVAALLMIIYGAAISVSAAAFEFFYQTAVPEQIRGQVMGVANSLGGALAPLGTALAGLVIATDFMRHYLVGVGIVCFLLGVHLKRVAVKRRQTERSAGIGPA